MKPLTLAAALAVLASCSAVSSRTDLVISGVVAGTYDPGPPAKCTLVLGTESDFLALGPDTTGHVGLVVENRLLSNITNSKFELPQNDFQPDRAVVSYELISPGSSLLPAGSVERPAGGFVKSGSQATVGVILFDAGQLAALGLADQAFFRASVYLKGTLAGGQSARTSTKEYLFKYCSAAGCAGNVCL